jgi:hypothetical protein
MRSRFLTAALCGALLALTALAGCDNSFVPQDGKPAALKGTVRVAVDNGQTAQNNARTAVPTNPDFTYTLTFTADGKSDVTASLDGNEGEVAIDAGTWTLSVIGTKNEERVAESDPVIVTVPAEGPAVSVAVTVYPALNGANGTFRYNIVDGEALTEVSAALTPLDVGSAEQDEMDLTIGEQTVSIAPGYYWFKVTAHKGSQTLIRREVVHIYSYTETTKTYDLMEEDFVDDLANAEGGESTDNPVPLTLSVNLANGGWEAVLSAINAIGKYVALDLSACTMDGTEFDLGTADGADKVTALVLPDAAKSIKAGGWFGVAFQAFTALESISAVGVEIIGGFAFYACTALESVSLPAATDIGGGAFLGCANLTTVSLPVATDIGGGAFRDCTSLESVSLPVATSIGDSVFSGCTSLESVSLPAATGIGQEAFRGCTSLTEVSLPVATSIGTYAFYGCTSLTSMSLPMATSIGDWAFGGYVSLETVSLPVAASIGEYAFSSCANLKTMSLPIATSIGTLAFAGCDALTSVSLPAVIDIGYNAFYACTALESVSLPASLTIIEGNPFGSCPNLTSITIDPANTAFIFSNDMLMDKAETTLIAYPTATGDITLLTITAVGYGAFAYCASLESVSLPAVTSISDGAFAYCTALESVSLPMSTSIGYSAFSQCFALTSVSLPAATSIGDNAFSICTALATACQLEAEFASIGCQSFARRPVRVLRS